MSESSMHLLAAAAVDEQESTTSPASSAARGRRSAADPSDDNSAAERNKAKKARKDLEKRARASLLERQREARRLEREEKKTKAEQENEGDKKEEAKSGKAKKKSAETSGREQAREERKRKSAEKMATQNRLAAEERERKRKQDEEKSAVRKQEEEKIAEAKKAEKERDVEIMTDKLKTVAHEAAAQQVDQPTYTDLMNKATVAAKEAAENAKNAKAKGAGAITATDFDVLLGRGGATNAHLGNKRFRGLVLKIQPEYITLRSRAMKSRIARSIVDEVHKYGGRFLKDVDGDWVEVSEDVAQKKASQALRENAKELKQLRESKAASAANGEDTETE